MNKVAESAQDVCVQSNQNAFLTHHRITTAEGSFGLFWLIYICTLMIGIVLAYFVAAASPNMDVANAVLPAYVTTLLFFAGFVFDFEKMPQWWKWYSCAFTHAYPPTAAPSLPSYPAHPNPPGRGAQPASHSTCGGGLRERELRTVLMNDPDPSPLCNDNADTDFMRFAWGALMVNQFSEVDPIWQGGKTVLQNYHLKAR